MARKKDWQEGCSSNSRETEDKLIDFLPSFLGHLTFNNIYSMHGHGNIVTGRERLLNAENMQFPLPGMSDSPVMA